MTPRAAAPGPSHSPTPAAAAHRPVARGAREPLDGVERLLIDGTNLLHALSERPGAAPAAALIGRLRAVIPASVRIELVLDGSPDPGMRGTRLASGLTVRNAGRLTGDALLLRLVVEATGGFPDASGVPAVLVVTDDGRLAHDLRVRGAATLGTSWLIRRLERPRLAAPSVGRPRPPAVVPGSRGAPDTDRDADERPRWRPGRGATTKRGNPRRGHP